MSPTARPAPACCRPPCRSTASLASRSPKVAHRLLRRSVRTAPWQARAAAARPGSRHHGAVPGRPTGSGRTEAFVTLAARPAR